MSYIILSWRFDEPARGRVYKRRAVGWHCPPAPAPPEAINRLLAEPRRPWVVAVHWWGDPQDFSHSTNFDWAPL